MINIGGIMRSKYLKKHTQIREENLKYDFLPSMVEIIEKPANKMGTIILFLIILCES